MGHTYSVDFLIMGVNVSVHLFMCISFVRIVETVVCLNIYLPIVTTYVGRYPLKII